MTLPAALLQRAISGAAKRQMMMAMTTTTRLSAATPALQAAARHTAVVAAAPRRYFSNNKDGEDPFGVHFEDGSDKLGPDSPPRYKRDAITGKFTGEQETELTPEEKKLLNMDPIEEQEYLLDKVMK
ncbi:MAG: hypothetical protein SGARI_003575, partial [Bacillariaceae sp.]